MSSQYTSLASELRRLSLEHSQLQSQNNEHDKLKHELLVIHRRKVDEQEERCNRLQSTSRQYRKKRRKKKKKRSSSTIYPVHHHKQSTGTIGELPINALLSIESKHNSSYNKDYISLSNEYKSTEKYRFHHNRKRDGGRESPPCLHCHSSSRQLRDCFFPCQHICVCRKCLERLPNLQQCPLCNSTIR